MLYPQRLLLSGKYQPGDISVIPAPSSLPPLPANLERALEKAWQAQLRRAAEEGYALWDAPCYRWEECHSIPDGKLALSVSEIPYKYVRGSIALLESGKLPEGYESRQMYSSLVIRTADGQYVFGISAKEFYVGELKFIGGVYGVTENRLTDGYALFQSALRELEEEVNISADQVKEMTLSRIYATPRGMRDLCFKVEVAADAAGIRRAFASRPDPELSDLLILSPVKAREAVAALTDRRREKADLVEVV
jgi:8-oxo-dGTP pyrophosphatase MutT (NUDIX family)